MLAPDAAAAIASVSTRTIYRWIEAGELHFQENPDRRLLVCSASLLTRIKKTGAEANP